MTKMSCFSILIGRKKKSKGEKGSSDSLHYSKDTETLKLKLVNNPDKNGLNSASFSISVPFGLDKDSSCKVKVVSDDSVRGAEEAEVAYEGGDEGDEDSLVKKEFSDFDPQTKVTNNGEDKFLSMNGKISSFNSLNEMDQQSENESAREAELGVELIQTGHVSDPGTGRVEFWASPMLKRSCSNLETSGMLKKIAYQLPPSKCHSFEDLHDLIGRARNELVTGIRGSPASVMTPRSADRVMLKKHSSSQLLPSGSRKIWWKLFLWSHRNLHNSKTVKPKQLIIDQSMNQRGGYCSDTLEPSRPRESGKLKSEGSFTEESQNNKNQNWNKFNDGVSGLLLQNQWVAFSTESSSLTRVDEWVNNLDIQSPQSRNEEENYDEGIVFPPSPEAGSSRTITHMNRHHKVNVSEDVLHANTVIQSLNSSSNVAHIAAMNLKVIPTISHFSSLRSVNLSGNFIVRITPGSLPKGLHSLNLSRNKIVAIEGLKELTRLRVLDLSYNRISRLGHGLSNCTLIKELYLAGNKISDLDGLHRLLKLTVLDLSFNKVTTAKALGQLVANYNSLLALNILGNPIQSNIGDDQLRKVVSGILPQLAYLNKQTIKPQRAREVAMDGVAKAALGTNARTSHRRASKRVSQVGSSHSGHNKSKVGSGQKSKQRSKK